MFSLKFKKIEITFVVLLIFFGSFIRFYNLNFDDLWSDEMVAIGYQIHFIVSLKQ